MLYDAKENVIPTRPLGELMDFTKHDKETEEFLKELYHRNWFDRLLNKIESLLGLK